MQVLDRPFPPLGTPIPIWRAHDHPPPAWGVKATAHPQPQSPQPQSPQPQSPQPQSPQPKTLPAAPWPTCPICDVHPEALYIDCREVAFKRSYQDPYTNKDINTLPVKFPSGRVVCPDIYAEKAACCCNGELTDAEQADQRKENQELEGAPKILGKKNARDLLRRWSGYKPTQVYKERPGATAKILRNDYEVKALGADERKVSLYYRFASLQARITSCKPYLCMSCSLYCKRSLT